MSEYDLMVTNHTESRDAGKLPTFKVTLDSKDPKMRLSLSSSSNVIFEEYPRGHVITMRLEKCAQTKLSDVPEKQNPA